VSQFLRSCRSVRTAKNGADGTAGHVAATAAPVHICGERSVESTQSCSPVPTISTATISTMADDVYSVQRSLRIGAPPERIYDQIADFRKWRNWSPWEDLDPALERSYSGAEAGTTAAYAWSGNRKAGRGRMTITEATEPSRVQIDLVFEKPWKSRNDTLFNRAGGVGVACHLVDHR